MAHSEPPRGRSVFSEILDMQQRSITRTPCTKTRRDAVIPVISVAVHFSSNVVGLLEEGIVSLGFLGRYVQGKTLGRVAVRPSSIRTF
jgi:hypothetical protein